MTRHALPYDPAREPAVLAAAAREWATLMVWTGARMDDRDRFILWQLLDAIADHLEAAEG